MSRPALKSLTIEHLRGSTRPFKLDFEKSKKLTVIYGENASGKSTVCDSLEFLGKGKVGSLENRGLGRPNKYWHSIGKQAGDIAVTLEAGEEKCRASIVKGGVVADPPAVRPIVEVLRRSQILGLIEAQPAARYAEISRFIDVSGVESAEDALRRSIRDLNDSRTTAIARINENERSIQHLWETAGKPKESALAWARGEAKREVVVNEAELKALETLQAAYGRLVGVPPQSAGAAEMLSAAKAAVTEADKKLAECLGSVAKDAGEVVGVLRAAQSYMQRHQTPEVCPLCESPDKVENLSQRVDDRLKAFASLQNAQNDRRTAGAKEQAAMHQLSAATENAKRCADDFDRARDAFAWPSDVALPPSPTPHESAPLSGWLSKTGHLPAEWKQVEARRRGDRQFQTIIQGALKIYDDNVSAQKELDELIPRMERALAITAEERRKFCDAILVKIAAEVGRLYEAVHPGEGLDKISLELDPLRRASLEIEASFCGQAGTPPQAYFSDSHLDTLGLCVFLALSSMDQPQDKVLVLDDVLGSVDEPHVERLIELLYAEAMKFRHCLITTHYGPWRHKLRWGWLKNGQCQFIELARWTNHDGISMIRTLPDVERLRLLLSEKVPDPQAICSKAGVILEAALNFLTILYECAVPRKAEDRHTLEDLLPNISGKLRDALRVDVLVNVDAGGAKQFKTLPLAPFLNELQRIAQARNVFGCHFKELSFELLDADAVGFGKQVLMLMDVLTDADAGWPKNDKSGEYWATSGETRRLYPLKKPK